MRTRTFTTKRRPSLACAMLLATAALGAGCRTDNSTVLLERDLRMQEDKIYHLQSCLEDACAAREATIRENEALKRELASGDRGAGSDADAGAERDFAPPSVELPGDDTTPRSRLRDSRPDLTPPEIELPEGSDTPPVETGPLGQQSTVVERPPTQLVINKRLTGGLDRDGHGGDEGIFVVVEPRDAAGNLVKWPGAVSVVLMDPALEGDEARIARWDFDEHEVPAHFQNTVFGRGLQFELRWPNRPPQHRELVVFVRYTTDQGQKLTTDAKINVRPPEDPGPIDRQTKRRGDDRGAATDRAPRSRILGRSSDSEAPRASQAPSGTDSAQSPTDEEGRYADEGHDESPTRTARPEWKPYR